MLQGLHHIAIICSQYERSRHFYTQVLGGEVLAENIQAHRGTIKLDLMLPGGTQIELFHFPAAPARPSGPEAQGARHIAFKVIDIDAAKRHFEALGVRVESIRVDPYTQRRFTFMADPDGLPLELYEA